MTKEELQNAFDNGATHYLRSHLGGTKVYKLRGGKMWQVLSDGKLCGSLWLAGELPRIDYSLLQEPQHE